MTTTAASNFEAKSDNTEATVDKDLVLCMKFPCGGAHYKIESAVEYELEYIYIYIYIYDHTTSSVHHEKTYSIMKGNGIDYDQFDRTSVVFSLL